MEKYITGAEQAKENDQKLVANHWEDQERWKTEAFKKLEQDAQNLASAQYTAEKILDVARSGRAMTAKQALAVLTQDKIQEQKEKPHTDY